MKCKLISLKGKIVLITGSSIGIGAATAEAFSREGSTVVITYYHDEKEAKQVEKECIKLGANETQVIQLNVMDDASIRNAVESVIKKFKQIDILVNNAGVIAWNKFSKQTFEDIERQTRTNVEGLMKMTLAADSAIAHLKHSRGWTRKEFRVPDVTFFSAMIRLAEFKRRAQNSSCFKSRNFRPYR